jgi:hypothetical protein
MKSAKKFLEEPIDNSIYMEQIASELSRFTREMKRITREAPNMQLFPKITVPDIVVPPAVVNVPEPIPPRKWKFIVNRDRRGMINEIIAEKEF